MTRKEMFVGMVSVAIASLCAISAAQAPVKYEPTIESLNRHEVPAWYSHAKLGIFIHWGLYSVPGWAPLSHPDHDFETADYIKYNPYAEWYLNVMRIDGSPTQAYHREHYGKDFDYYNFAPVFDKEIQKWNPDEMAKIFRDAGARYVVLTSKHHEGFTLWPSAVANPTLPKDRQHAARDIVGELTDAVRKQDMKMGIYYSGGYDWTFVPGPITKPADYETVKPQSEAYGKYANAQIHELIQRYHPSVLWNDIDWPKTGKAMEVEADYYNAVPDGVIDDRFGIKHADFTSPEYQKVDKISPKKWEECRGLGRSFGYNRAEGEAETIAPGELIALLVDIVSKNGNLLARRGAGGRRHDSAGADGAAERAGRMAQAKRFGNLRHGAVGARGWQERRGRRSALYLSGAHQRHCAGHAQSEDADHRGHLSKAERRGLHAGPQGIAEVEGRGRKLAGDAARRAAWQVCVCAGDSQLQPLIRVLKRLLFSKESQDCYFNQTAGFGKRRLYWIAELFGQFQ